jgi:hypothetical protein
MSKEAMKLALEALDELYLPGELERVNKAITALREALAEQFCDTHCTWLDHHPDCDKAEQPAQSTADKSELEIVPANGSLLPAQQQEAKRTAWIFENRHGEKYTPKDHVFTRAEAEVSAMLLGHKSIGPAWLNEACEPAVDGITKGNT